MGWKPDMRITKEKVWKSTIQYSKFTEKVWSSSNIGAIIHGHLYDVKCEGVELLTKTAFLNSIMA